MLSFASVPFILLETPSWDVLSYPCRVQQLLNDFGRLGEIAKATLGFYLFMEGMYVGLYLEVSSYDVFLRMCLIIGSYSGICVISQAPYI